MRKSEYMEMLKAYRAELTVEDSKGSTGSAGKLWEVLTRQIMARHGITDPRCRSSKRQDGRIGRSVPFEVKTGSGVVYYGEVRSKDEICEDLVLRGAAIVFFAPYAADIYKEVRRAGRELETSDVLNNTWVFTREQFITMLVVMGAKGRGLQSSLKLSKDGLNIQTISHGSEDRMWSVMQDMPMLKDFR